MNYELHRLQQKARGGEALTAREGLWLVEKVNQLRDALAQNQGSMLDAHPLVVKMAVESALKAQADANLLTGVAEPPRGNQSWAEWGLDAPGC